MNFNMSDSSSNESNSSEVSEGDLSSVGPMLKANKGCFKLYGKKAVTFGIFGKSLAGQMHEFSESLAFIHSASGTNRAELIENIEKGFLRIKNILLSKKAEKKEVSKLFFSLVGSEGIFHMINAMQILDLERQKDVRTIVKNLLLRNHEKDLPIMKHFNDNPRLTILLIQYCKYKELVYFAREMLKIAFESREVVKLVLKKKLLLNLFVYLRDSSFEVSTNSLFIIRDVLCEHPSLHDNYLCKYYKFIFNEFWRLIQYENFFVQTAAAEVIESLLLPPGNSHMLLRFFADEDTMEKVFDLVKKGSTFIRGISLRLIKAILGKTERPEYIVKYLTVNARKIEKLLAAVFPLYKDDENLWDEKTWLENYLATLKKYSVASD